MSSVPFHDSGMTISYAAPLISPVHATESQPVNGTARSRDEAFGIAAQVGYPLVIRPSFVLGGRAMEIVRDDAQLERYIRTAVQVSGDSPVLLDSYLSGAIEVDVDALCDGEAVHVAGIMEHIEEAGIHSGDSACVLPAMTISDASREEVRVATLAAARSGSAGLLRSASRC